MIYFVSLFSFLFILAVGAIGEDRIRLKNGEVLQGQAVKFDEGSMTLTFKFAQGTLGYPSSDLAVVNLEERPGVAGGSWHRSITAAGEAG